MGGREREREIPERECPLVRSLAAPCTRRHSFTAGSQPLLCSCLSVSVGKIQFAIYRPAIIVALYADLECLRRIRVLDRGFWSFWQHEN